MGDAPGLGGLPEPRRDKRIVRPGEGGQIDLGFEPADVKHLVRRQAAADRARQEERAAYGPPAAVPYPQDRIRNQAVEIHNIQAEAEGHEKQFNTARLGHQLVGPEGARPVEP